MSKELEVRYVDLPDMTVASALGFGKEPENEAAKMMNAFTTKLGFTPGSPEHPSYGFKTRIRRPEVRTTATSCGAASIPTRSPSHRSRSSRFRAHDTP